MSVEPDYFDGRTALYHGDALAVLRELADGFVDAIVTDPPYGLEFMGREWDGADGFRRSLNPADIGRESVFGRTSRTSPEYRAGVLYQQWCEAWAAECLRVLKPGGHLLAFGGTRTYHRLTCAIEDAGFEIRDSISWLYGSGFPKSLDVSKAIDKAAGAEREVMGKAARHGGPRDSRPADETQSRDVAYRFSDDRTITAPATDDARRWSGWGTALKPAHEPIVVARKPLAGTVVQNILAYGTGALNVDGCRVAHDGTGVWGNHGQNPANHVVPPGHGGETLRDSWHAPGSSRNDAGRWPPNVLLDEDAAAELDRQSGTLTSGANPTRRGADGNRAAFGEFRGQDDANPQRGVDSGGASRFFPIFRYQAKAPTRERPRINGAPAHPTVKPLELMRWLIRLVAPPDAIVADPFVGSGTTIEACMLEGFRCLAIEREADYLPLIMARIERARGRSATAGERT